MKEEMSKEDIKRLIREYITEPRKRAEQVQWEKDSLAAYKRYIEKGEKLY